MKRYILFTLLAVAVLALPAMAQINCSDIPPSPTGFYTYIQRIGDVEIQGKPYKVYSVTKKTPTGCPDEIRQTPHDEEVVIPMGPGHIEKVGVFHHVTRLRFSVLEHGANPLMRFQAEKHNGPPEFFEFKLGNAPVKVR